MTEGEDRDGVYGKEKGMTYYWYYLTVNTQ